MPHTIEAAGGLTADYDNGSLRNIRLGGIEVLRSIYAAVRDPDWNTIPATISGEQIVHFAGGAEITFTATHQEGEIHFEWRGTIRIVRNRIEAAMDGVSLTRFRRNRVGFCVLHGAASCAGRECEVVHSDGSSERLRFPEQISPDQPFLDVGSLTHYPAPGVQATVSFEGEVFETEDQRNWTDDTFKTYCTPLALPFPVEVAPGTRIEQRVTLDIAAADSFHTPPEPREVTIRVHAGEVLPLPSLGVGWTPVTPAIEGLLQPLRLSHLRVDVCPSQSGWEFGLRNAAEDADTLGIPLEIAAHLSADAVRDLRFLRDVARGLDIARWIVYDPGPATTSTTIALAREFLSGRIGAGTDANFAELNRNRAGAREADFVVFSANPQVHGTDEGTMTDTLGGQIDAVRSARALSGGKPVWVTPITLKPRFNAVATTGAGQIEPPADVRQSGQFAAAWTLGSIAAMTCSGAHSATWFEAAGPRGIISPEGSVWPVYHVFAAIAGFRPDGAARCGVSQPRQAAALVLRSGRRRRILVANLMPVPTHIRIEPGTLRLALDPWAVVWRDL